LAHSFEQAMTETTTPRFTYIFSGLVHPQRAHLTLAFPSGAGISFTHQESQVSGRCSVQIYNNHITVAFTTEAQIADMLTARNMVADAVSLLIDGVSLLTVLHYSVELISVHDVTNDSTQVFGIDCPGLSRDGWFPASNDILQLFDFAGRNALYRRALTDFRLAQIVVSDTAFLCYRAIESILQIFAENKGISEKNTTAKLQALYAELNVSPDAVYFLRNRSKMTRHGRVEYMSGADRVRALRIAREILMRFAAKARDPAITWADPVAA
jgi:hypothetical protein